MKRILWLPVTFIVIVVLGAIALSIPLAQQPAPNKIEAASDRSVRPADFGSLSVIDSRKIAFQQPQELNPPKADFRSERERVEVLARSITFPGVINQGELLIKVEFPNAAILCLEAAYYAGRVQGLMWAMDRDTVIEHALHWTIDDANDLFNSCLRISLQGAAAGQNVNDRIPLKDVKEVLSEQIQIIQNKLGYAQHVKINGGVPIVVEEQ